jgi:uncharacterized protein YrrD
MQERPITAQVASGQRVFCADSELIGTVKDVTSKQFQVSPERGRDFWLDRQQIDSVQGDAVRMNFAASELDSFRLQQRDADAAPAAAAEQDTLGVLGDDVARQRESMERELAMQRERLRHRHEAGSSSPPDTGGTYGEPVEKEMARAEGVPASTVVERAAMEAQEPISPRVSPRPTMAIRDARVFRGMPVKAARDGRAVGTVKELLFDPDEKAVAGVVVSSTTPDAPGVFVARNHIELFGSDAVTVDSAVPIEQAHGESSEAPAGGVPLEGVRVVTDDGDAMGKIDRVLVDERGEITGYHTKSGIFGRSQHDIAAGDVVSLRDDAQVVRGH